MSAGERDAGEQVEALLERIGEQGGAQAAASAEELVRVLVDFYGAGLARVVEVVGAAALTKDPQLESLLVLHDLHPLSLDERIEQALDRVRPYLGSHAGGVAFLGVDDHNVAQLRLDGSCDGCPSSTVTVQTTIEDAVLGAAPELDGIAVVGTDKPLLQIGPRPGIASAPVWHHPSARELPAEGTVSGVRLEGRAIVLARLGESYYAYRDACAACGSSLATATLDGDVLHCPHCAAAFDVRLAGTGLDGSGRRLEPLPLLDDTSGIRIALVPQPEPVG